MSSSRLASRPAVTVGVENDGLQLRCKTQKPIIDSVWNKRLEAPPQYQTGDKCLRVSRVAAGNSSSGVHRGEHSARSAFGEEAAGLFLRNVILMDRQISTVNLHPCR